MERFFLVSPIEKMDVRDTSANGDNTWTMSGYAAVFGHTATLFDSEFQRVTVTISPEAFSNVFAEQGFATREGAVRFNYGHEMDTAVAATDIPVSQPGGLELSVDKNGLRFLARVSRDDPDAVRLAAKMKTGVVRQASFAFNSKSTIEHGDEIDGKAQAHRTITEVTRLYDVCAAVEGVFNQTVSGLQMYAKSLGQPELSGADIVSPDLGGESFVSPDSGGEAATPSDEPSDVMVAASEALAAVRIAAWNGGLIR